MTVIAEDEEGNEVTIRKSSGLAKFSIDDDFAYPDRARSILVAAARRFGLPLIDMDEVHEQLLAAAEADPDELPDELSVTEHVSGETMTIEIDMTVEDADDIEERSATFFETDLGEEPHDG